MIREYYRPTSLDDAVALATQPGAAIVGGGTALIAEPGDTETIVDLQSLGLDGIVVERDTVRIGSTATLEALTSSRDVPQIVRDLAYRELPSALRNAATLGGTVALCEPDSELVTALLALEARLDVVAPDGANQVDIATFHDRGLPGVIVSIEVPTGGRSVSERTGRTPMDRPIVCAVAHHTAEGDLRLAFGGVAARPVVLEIDDIAQLDPPADFRGSSDYRRHLASVLAQRALTSLGSGR